MALTRYSGTGSWVMSRYVLIITVFLPSSVTSPAARSLCFSSDISAICSLLLAVIDALGWPVLSLGIVLAFWGSKASVDL